MIQPLPAQSVLRTPDQGVIRKSQTGVAQNTASAGKFDRRIVAAAKNFPEVLRSTSGVSGVAGHLFYAKVPYAKLAGAQRAAIEAFVGEEKDSMVDSVQQSWSRKDVGPTLPEFDVSLYELKSQGDVVGHIVAINDTSGGLPQFSWGAFNTNGRIVHNDSQP